MYLLVLVGVIVSLDATIHQEKNLTESINNLTNGSLSYKDKNNDTSYFQRSLPIHTALIPTINKRRGNWSKFLKEAWKYKNKTLVAMLPRVLDKVPFTILSKTIVLKRQLTDCIYSHNYLREFHGLPLLRWDGDLAYSAENWAMQLAERNQGLTHSHMPTDEGLWLGENGYLGVHKDCGDAVWYWYR